MSRRHLIAASAVLGVSRLSHRPAVAASFPSRPVRIYVGAPAGTIPDILARVVVDQLSATFPQPIVVDNKPGPGGGITAMHAVLAATPDGHVLGLTNLSLSVFDTYLFPKLGYDAVRDFDPICLLASNAFCVAAGSKLPPTSMPELVEWAKSRPGELLIATSPSGSPPHVYAHLLSKVAGIKVTYVPFKSGPEAIAALGKGDVHVAIDSPATMIHQATAGELRVLAVTGKTREAELPDVPTLAELNMPEAQCESWFGIVGRSGVPRDVVQELSSRLRAALTAPQMTERLAKMGFSPIGSSPDQFRTLIQEEHQRWAGIIQDAGLRIE